MRPTVSVANSEERMLQELNWEKLELRRQKLRLSFLHKINYNLVDIHINNFVNRSDSTTRGSQRLQQSFTADTILFNEFIFSKDSEGMKQAPHYFDSNWSSWNF